MSPTNPRPTILVTGAAGGLASLVIHALVRKYRLVGVDPRPLKTGTKFPGEFFEVDYTSRKMAEIFRQERFEVLLHLGRVPLGSDTKETQRYNTNVMGTRNLLELAAKYHVPRILVCSTFHVYGAHPHNHLQMTESDPLRASHIFPELVDAVEMDNVSTNFMLRNPGIKVIVLRPVNVVGPRIRNRISMFLRSKYCPYLMGYDPPMQFIHERDLTRAIRITIESNESGIFNVAGEGLVAYTRAIELAGSHPLPLPHFLAYPAAALTSRLGTGFPAHLIDYFRYPTVLSDDLFRKTFGFKPEVSTVEALQSLGPKTTY